MFNKITATYEMTKEGVKTYTDTELGICLNYANEEYAHAKQCFNIALNSWVSSWKVENAKKNLEIIKVKQHIIVDELIIRGVKSVKRTGEVVYS